METSTGNGASRLFQAGWVNQAARSYQLSARSVSQAGSARGVSDVSLEALGARYGGASDRLARLGSRIRQNADVAVDVRDALVKLRASLSNASGTAGVTDDTTGAAGTNDAQSANGSASDTTPTTSTVIASRTYTGNVDLTPSGRRGTIAGAENGMSFTVEGSDGTAITVNLNKNSNISQVLERLNAVTGISATLDGDNYLAITIEGDNTLTFANTGRGDALGTLGLSAPSESIATRTVANPDSLNGLEPNSDPAPQEETEAPAASSGTADRTGEAADAAYQAFRTEAIRLLTGGSGRDASILAGGTAALGVDTDAGFQLALDRFDLSAFGLDARRALATDADVQTLIADIDTAITGLDFRITGLDQAAQVAEVTQGYTGKRQDAVSALIGKARDSAGETAMIGSASYFRDALRSLAGAIGYR